MPKTKFCQSCMMPLNKDPKKGGTNKDGTYSDKYCSYCYAEGEFIGEIENAEEMREFVINKMKEMGYPKFIARLMTMGFNKLERWK
jgi:hypothetical protein